MQISPVYRRGVLIMDVLLLLLSVYAASLVAVKPDLPFKTEFKNDSVRIVLPYEQQGRILSAGTAVASVGPHSVRSVLEVEYIVDHYTMGQVIPVRTSHGSIDVRLVSYYQTSYLLSLAISGFSFFFFAIFLWVKSPNDPSARLAHWVSLVIALVIAFDWGKATEHSVFMRMFYTVSYSFAPYFLAKFSQEYPVRLGGWRNRVLWGMLFVALALAATSSIGLLYLDQRVNYEDFSVYELPTKFMEVFFAIGAIYSVMNFIYAYQIAVEESDRRRIRWVLLGYAFSCTSYVILWLLPKIFGLGAIVSEELVLVTVSVAPFTFAVSVLKYHLFDIDRIANRATVYLTVLTFLVCLYVGTVAAIAAAIELKTDDRLPGSINIVAAVLVALLFEPVKRRVQAFVDRRFFKVKYDYGQILSAYSTKFEDVYDRVGLDASLKVLCEEVLHVTDWQFHRDVLTSETRAYRCLGIAKYVEDGAPFDAVEDLGDKVLRVPIRVDRVTRAFLDLGTKRSQLRYSVEDIELLNSISALVGGALSRIALTENLAEEKMRAERLNELNELKSVFVSSVTHDLKTPLTSIKLFTEMLETAYGPDQETAREYLGIISGESDRLRTLIDNVLDHTKIERGVMTYNFAVVDLTDLITDVLRRLDYLISMQGFELRFEHDSTPIEIEADRSLLESAITNLLSNAMKYSAHEKQIHIRLEMSGATAVFSIADRGVGISKADLPHIFQPFYRCQQQSSLQASGAGLGLSNVQHIIEAHKGKIDVESVLGVGTRFTLTIPVLVQHEQDTHH